MHMTFEVGLLHLLCLELDSQQNSKVLDRNHDCSYPVWTRDYRLMVCFGNVVIVYLWEEALFGVVDLQGIEPSDGPCSPCKKV